MPSPPKEPDHYAALAKAEQDIVAAERRLSRQERLARKLAADSPEDQANEAELLTTIMQQTLDLLREHRELILREIAVEEGGLADRRSSFLAILKRVIRPAAG
jgi:hypothetical protein